MRGRKDETAYHLTRDGWVAGERPANAIESWTRWSFRETGRPKQTVGWTSIWADFRMTRTDRDALRRRHRALIGTPGVNGDISTSIGDPI